MARKLNQAVGPKGGLRRGWFLLVSLALVVASTAVFIPGVLAVHDTGAFQLDGNAETSVQSPIPANDDWDRVCNEATGGAVCASAGPTTGAIAVAWSEDNLLGGGPSLDATIFTGGGSKDPIDIDQWAWKDGSGGLPDKANLLHSFAVRYSLPDSSECPSGTAPTCEVLFFGSDRYDNSGDAVQGFWFFQDEITLGTNKIGGGFGFNGLHQDGDLLVISEFSNGGTRSTIFVYQWNSAVSGNLELLASSTAANCAQVGANDAFCGIVNSSNGTTAPWPFLDKSGNNTFLRGEFFEAGINLSTLGLADRCFASVASETRTSTSTTSVLKDFVLGSFGNCETSLVTTPQTGDGIDIPAEGISIGTGSVSVQDSAELTVVGIPTWTGTLSFFLCGVDTGLCETGGTQIGSSVTVTNATPQPIVSATTDVTAAGEYCWRGEFVSGTEGVPDATDASAGECFTVNPVTPTIVTNAVVTAEIGGAISDTATIGNTANDPDGNPAGGTVTFFAYGPDDATCANAPAFTSAAIAVSGDGDYGSGDFTPTTAGTYLWVATYTGDSPNTTGPVSTACGDPNETSEITPKTPTIVTVAVAGPVPLGSPISDTATIGNTANDPDGNPAGGTVTFFAYGPDDATCANAPAFTSAAIAVSGDGDYGSGDFTPTEAGTYLWVATYTGDPPNTTGPVSTACGDPNETSEVVQLQPTMDTAQQFVPNDSATITVVDPIGGNLAGTVVFELFVDDASCAGPAAYTSAAIDITTGVGDGLSQTVMSANTTAYTTSSTFHWVVTYTSANTAHKDVTSGCGNETSSITINNGETQPSA